MQKGGGEWAETVTGSEATPTCTPLLQNPSENPGLEQTSVTKLQLVYARDCGSMVPVLTMHFPWAYLLFLSLFYVSICLDTT